MKNFVSLAVLLALGSTLCFGQELTFSNGTYVKSHFTDNNPASGTLDAQSNAINNRSEREMNLKFTLLQNTLPFGWTAKICFPGICYFTIVPKAESPEVFPISPKSEGTIKLSTDTKGESGKGIVSYLVQEPGTGNTDTLTFDLDTERASVSSNDLPSLSFSVYPNPSTGEVNIITSGNTPKKVEVYDIAGQIVVTDVVISSAQTLDLGGLANGAYTLRIVDNTGAYNVKPLYITR